MLTEIDKENNKGHYPAVKGKKRKMAEMLVNPDNELSVTALCEELKVSRQTFYNWMKDPDFRGYMDFLIDSYTDSELANVWKALIRRATKNGDVQAQKLYFELKDKYKQNVNVNGAVIIVDDLNA
jgi:thiaminase